MSNHPHIIAVFKDADAAKRFYTEVTKKITDYMKALLGLKRLNLWKKRPNVGHILRRFARVALHQLVDFVPYFYKDYIEVAIRCAMNRERDISRFMASDSSVLPDYLQKELSFIRREKEKVERSRKD